MFAGAPPEVVAALTEYGEKIGCAFQLSDDILDVGSDSDESGKTPGTDLREGVWTLPTLLAMRSSNPADGRLLELLSGPLTDDAPHAEALDLLRAHPAMEDARAYVLELAREATSVLAVLPEGPVKEALVTFADVVATRTA
jgi:heptaprenyl diphosphate synthase